MNGIIVIDEGVPFGKAQDLAMLVSLGNIKHPEKIFVIRYVTGNMEAEKPAHHDGSFYLTPIGFRIVFKKEKIALIRLSYAWPNSLKLLCITLFVTLA